jgi:exonuclease SbcD
MIRVAHFSDLHYGTRTLAEADRCFGAAIDRAIALRVEAAVISGDATDHPLDLHAPAAVRLIAQVRRLADHCPVLHAAGHVLARTSGHAGGLPPAGWAASGARRRPHRAGGADGAWRVDRIEGLALRCGTAGCLARCSAACRRSTRRRWLRWSVRRTAAQAVGEHLADLLRGYAPIHRAARAQGLPTIGVSHGTVFGCISEHGVPMAGFDHEFTTGALFGAEAQAFMLGHIHRHQSWVADGAAGQQCIAYPGSIGRFHYGEEGDKGFLVWEVGPDGARCTLEPTPARRTLDIVFEGKPDLDVLRSVVEQQQVGGAFVRVRWVVADEDRHEVDRAAILRLLAGAAEAKLEGRIVPVARSRAQGISRMASLDDKVRAWAAATGVNPTPLLACLAKSIAAPPQDIVEQALRFDEASAESDVDDGRSEDRLVVHSVGAEECNHSH